MASDEDIKDAARRFCEGTLPGKDLIALVADASGRFWVLAQKITHCRSLAEDAVQDALFGFMKAVHRRTPIRDPMAFLATSVIRRACTLAKTRQRTAPMYVDLRVDPLTPELLFHYRQVREALEALGPAASEQLIAQAIEGVSSREFAAQTGQTVSAVRSSYFRRRGKLKEALREF